MALKKGPTMAPQQTQKWVPNGKKCPPKWPPTKPKSGYQTEKNGLQKEPKSGYQTERPRSGGGGGQGGER
jgi:hypothetical protein